MDTLTLTSPDFTHAQLVQRAALWLRNNKRCRVVLTEQTTGSGEIPDALGWKYLTESHLIEVKVSRSDFLADRAKPFRCDSALGMGCFRYFMAPKGVLKLGDLDEKCGDWGLLEVKGRSVYVVREPKPHLVHNQTEEIAQQMADWARFARWLYEGTAKDHARRDEDAHLCSPPAPNKRRADASPRSADGCLLHQPCRDGPFALLRAWRQNAQTIESVNGPSHRSSCEGE